MRLLALDRLLQHLLEHTNVLSRLCISLGLQQRQVTVGLSLLFLEFLPPGYFVFIYGSEGFGFSHFWMALPFTGMMGVIQGSGRWTKDSLHNMVYKLRRHMIWTIWCCLVLRLCRSFHPFSFHLLYVWPSISDLKSPK